MPEELLKPQEVNAALDCVNGDRGTVDVRSFTRLPPSRAHQSVALEYSGERACVLGIYRGEEEEPMVEFSCETMREAVGVAGRRVNGR